MEEITRYGIITRKRLDDLPRSPLRSWMLGNIEMNDLPSIMAHDDEAEQQPKCYGIDDKEVAGSCYVHMIL